MQTSLELLKFIGFTVEILLFSIIVVHVLNWEGISSGFITCFVYFGVQGLGFIIRPIVIDYISPINIEVGRLFYYFGFAFIDLVAIVLITKIHKEFVIVFSFPTLSVLFILKALAVIQVIRLIDRQVGIDLLASIYSHSLPSLNMAVIAFLLFDLIKNKKFKRI